MVHPIPTSPFIQWNDVFTCIYIQLCIHDSSSTTVLWSKTGEGERTKTRETEGRRMRREAEKKTSPQEKEGEFCNKVSMAIIGANIHI